MTGFVVQGHILFISVSWRTKCLLKLGISYNKKASTDQKDLWQLCSDRKPPVIINYYNCQALYFFSSQAHCALFKPQSLLYFYINSLSTRNSLIVHGLIIAIWYFICIWPHIMSKTKWYNRKRCDAATHKTLLTTPPTGLTSVAHHCSSSFQSMPCSWRAPVVLGDIPFQPLDRFELTTWYDFFKRHTSG